MTYELIQRFPSLDRQGQFFEYLEPEFMIHGYYAFMRNRTNVLLLIGVTVFWVIALVSKLKFNGLVYGLDFGLFHPDGQLYSFRTLTMAGNSEVVSGSIVSDWYREHAFKLNSIDPKSLYFDTHPLWELYKSRVLYPILSVPFVALFGMQGMLVIPALSMLILMISIQIIGFKLDNKFLAFLISVLISISPVVSRWMFANITDGLLTALASLFVVTFLYVKNSNVFLITSGFIIILGSYTRISVVQWLAVSLAIYLVKQKRNAILLGIVTIIFFIPSALRNIQTGILPNEEKGSLIDKPIQLMVSMARVGFYEISQLVVLDRLLILLLVVATIVSVFNLDRASSKFFLLVLVALWITGAVNGTIGVNFRYQLPLLPFMAYCIIESCKFSFIFKEKA